MTLPSVIVDSHVHLWDPSRFRYEWLKELPALNRSFLPKDFNAEPESNRIDKLIFIEGGCDASQRSAEVDWVLDLARSEPRLKAVIAHAALEKGDAVRTELKTLAERPLVKGVRRNLQGESDPEFCLRPEFVAGVARLAEFGLTFDVCIKHHQLRAVTQLAKGVPEVTFVLDHCGKPDVRSGTVEPWASDIRAFAALPNTVCKLSGLTTEADWKKWRSKDLENYIALVIRFFGFDRLLFGSDWPVATLATNYQRWLETITKAFSFASPSDCSKIFQTNAERIYRV